MFHNSHSKYSIKVSIRKGDIVCVTNQLSQRTLSNITEHDIAIILKQNFRITSTDHQDTRAMRQLSSNNVKRGFYRKISYWPRYWRSYSANYPFNLVRECNTAIAFISEIHGSNDLVHVIADRKQAVSFIDQYRTPINNRKTCRTRWIATVQLISILL